MAVSRLFEVLTVSPEKSRGDSRDVVASEQVNVSTLMEAVEMNSIRTSRHFHLDEAADWRDGWKLGCGCVCRHVPAPPTCPDGFVVYEYYSYPTGNTPSLGLLIVWVTAPEEIQLPWRQLSHSMAGSLQELAVQWGGVCDVDGIREVVVWDVGCSRLCR